MKRGDHGVVTQIAAEVWNPGGGGISDKGIPPKPDYKQRSKSVLTPKKRQPAQRVGADGGTWSVL